MHDGIGYAETAQQNAEEVKKSRHRHSKLRPHCACVDHRCNSVCGIMKTIDRFVKKHESQSKQ
ncbi:Uncharacterised protein [Klebsiella grimontii]|uniref:Uncharacterized protein n=1 Tax=Klebsiella grimontii TaxID=2058152 RepID=A0A7H4NV30_9ENTR|nr:Uncharacterised protein [Klebsiella grimontii]